MLPVLALALACYDDSETRAALAAHDDDLSAVLDRLEAAESTLGETQVALGEAQARIEALENQGSLAVVEHESMLAYDELPTITFEHSGYPYVERPEGAASFFVQRCFLATAYTFDQDLCLDEPLAFLPDLGIYIFDDYDPDYYWVRLEWTTVEPVTAE